MRLFSSLCPLIQNLVFHIRSGGGGGIGYDCIYNERPRSETMGCVEEDNTTHEWRDMQRTTTEEEEEEEEEGMDSMMMMGKKGSLVQLPLLLLLLPLSLPD